MITIDEIREVAAKVLLSNIVVEKDYALGWLLWGINQNPVAKNDWVFKGGTCLKKCYFETYRFSEDLDYTLLESEWENMLAHQVPMLPEKEVFWRELPNIFEWLHDKKEESE